MLKKRKRATQPTKAQLAAMRVLWIKMWDARPRNNWRVKREVLVQLLALVEFQLAAAARSAKVPGSRAAKRSSSGVKKTSRTTRRV